MIIILKNMGMIYYMEEQIKMIKEWIILKIIKKQLNNEMLMIQLSKTMR